MRQLHIIIALLLLAGGAMAQPIGGKKSNVSVLGSMSIDSAFKIPIRDTLSWAPFTAMLGAMTMRPQDSLVYVKARYWRLLGGNTISPGAGDIINGGQTGPISIGTTDVTTLNFLVNGVVAGGVDYANSLTHLGYNSFNGTTGNGTAIGEEAGMNNTAGGVVAVGFRSLKDNTGIEATASGVNSGQNNIGDHFTGVGINAGKDNTKDFFTGVGASAGDLNAGEHVTVVGNGSGANNTGDRLTAVGAAAGYANTHNDVTNVGYNTVSTADGGTAVGANAISTVADAVVLGSVNGQNGATVTAKTGIGTTAPTERLHVDGNIRLNGAFMPGNTAGTFGQVLTSAGVGVSPTWTTSSGGWTELHVAGSDFTTTSTSLVDVTGLVSSTVSTATLYEFQATLYINSSSTDGVILGVQQSGTGSGQDGVLSGTATSGASTGLAISSNALNAATAPCVLINGNGTATIMGFIKTASSGSPTISIQVGKTISGTTKIYIGSVFRYRVAQ